MTLQELKSRANVRIVLLATTVQSLDNHLLIQLKPATEDLSVMEVLIGLNQLIQPQETSAQQVLIAMQQLVSIIVMQVILVCIKEPLMFLHACLARKVIIVLVVTMVLLLVQLVISVLRAPQFTIKLLKNHLQATTISCLSLPIR
jgi:hypothetical protein